MCDIIVSNHVMISVWIISGMIFSKENKSKTLHKKWNASKKWKVSQRIFCFNSQGRKRKSGYKRNEIAKSKMFGCIDLVGRITTKLLEVCQGSFKVNRLFQHRDFD